MDLLRPIAFVFALTVTAVFGLLLVRRRTHHASLSKHNDVGGVIFSIVGTLYAVILAFVAIVVWEALGTADDRAAQEAGVLGDLMRDSGFFPDPERSQLQELFHNYAEAVVTEEWPAMETSSSSEHVWQLLNQIFETFSHINPSTQREANIHAEMLTRLNDLSDHRRLRLLAADNKVPPQMWVMLILGGIITIGFSYFLGVERGQAHVWMTAALTAMISLTLYLILALDHPFGGAIKVEPEGFRLVLDRVGPVDYTK